MQSMCVQYDLCEVYAKLGLCVCVCYAGYWYGCFYLCDSVYGGEPNVGFYYAQIGTSICNSVQINIMNIFYSMISICLTNRENHRYVVGCFSEFKLNLITYFFFDAWGNPIIHYTRPRTSRTETQVNVCVCFFSFVQRTVCVNQFILLLLGLFFVV
jgi:hypothetical protein